MTNIHAIKSGSGIAVFIFGIWGHWEIVTLFQPFLDERCLTLKTLLVHSFPTYIPISWFIYFERWNFIMCYMGSRRVCGPISPFLRNLAQILHSTNAICHVKTVENRIRIFKLPITNMRFYGWPYIENMNISKIF